MGSNIQREHLLPSEKAFAYKMKAEALKHQGKRTDLTSEQFAPKLSTAQIGDEEKISSMETAVERMQECDASQNNLIPQTETLLASYDRMTNEERNHLLKEVLMKIEYHKGQSGEIKIDLYPRIPRLSASWK